MTNGGKGDFTPHMPSIRRLCDEYSAWLHLDGGSLWSHPCTLKSKCDDMPCSWYCIAFGGFAALHPDFSEEVREGMMLADSLTLDGHKW